MSKISIIIPVYNCENYIDKCLKSVINQSYRNLEIIIVDDGSTDRSGFICDYYATLDTRIKVIHQNNQGLSMARNNALDIICGDYIGFVDSDDWIETDMYEFLLNNMIRYDADISTCCCQRINCTNYQYYTSLLTDSKKLLKGREIIKQYVNGYQTDTIMDVVWNKLYKRNLFANIRFPKNRVYEDHYVTYQLLDLAEKVVVTKEPKYYYLSRPGSLTNRPPDKHIFDLLDAYWLRFEYICRGYPEYRAAYKKILLTEIINVLYLLYKYKLVDVFVDEVDNIKNMIKNINIYDCGMDDKQIRQLELFNSNNKLWTMSFRIYDKRNC